MDAFKRMMRKVQDIRESRFAEGRRLIPCGDSALLRLEPSIYSGPKVALRSGQVVAPGARIAELHLDSRKIAEAYESMAPMKARVSFFRQAQDSFVWTAGWLLKDAVGRETVALRSTTFLDRELAHFGFEVMPLPLWPWVFVGIHMQWLSYLYRGETGGSRAEKRPAQVGKRARGRSEAVPLLKRMTPRQAWMGRQEFLEKYSDVKP